jgi:nitrile hydratase accessory protein
MMLPAKTPDEHPFAAPWQAQAFAMTLSLSERGVFTWTEWACALAAEIGRAPDREYYQQWLAALETLVTAKGVSTESELHRYRQGWGKAAHRTPHGAPIVLSEGDLHG